MIYKNVEISSVQGDIADQKADAIVNAANSSLAGGGGVDGALHRRGGPAIMAETDEKYPHGCPTGSAVISGAGNLNAQYVIHAVAPRYRVDLSNAPALLAAAYDRSLELAAEYRCRSIACPSLGTGAYHYPVAEAAQIAFDTVKNFIDRHAGDAEFSIQQVRFVLFDEKTAARFENIVRNS